MGFCLNNECFPTLWLPQGHLVENRYICVGQNPDIGEECHHPGRCCSIQAVLPAALWSRAGPEEEGCSRSSWHRAGWEGGKGLSLQARQPQARATPQDPQARCCCESSAPPNSLMKSSFSLMKSSSSSFAVPFLSRSTPGLVSISIPWSNIVILLPVMSALVRVAFPPLSHHFCLNQHLVFWHYCLLPVMNAW